MSKRAWAYHDWHWPRRAAEPLPPHMTLRAAMRSMRSAISLLLIDPPHAHENSASSSLESSKNRCASPTLPLLKPAAYRTFLALRVRTANQDARDISTHRVAVFQVDEEAERAGMPTPDHVGKALQSLALGHRRGGEGKFERR